LVSNFWFDMRRKLFYHITIMSRRCFVCAKKPVMGMSVSHSHRRTKRLWLPNLQNVTILVAGKKRKECVCTKCLKAGKVVKYAARA
jgi:large subunit ribosomal protein L28